MSTSTTAAPRTEKATTPQPPSPTYDHETRQMVYLVAFFSALALLVGSLALGLAAHRRPAPAQVNPAAGGNHDLFIAEHDFALSPNSATLTSGSVTVRIANFGPSSHELLAFRTDLPETALPVGTDGRVNEDDPTITKVLDTDTDLPPATERTTTLKLARGRYVFICNLLNHYRLGMHYTITIP